MDIFKKFNDLTLPTELREKGIYPYFHELQSKQDIEVTMEDRRLIMIGSNNYLGLTTHPDVIKAATDAINTFGTGCSGSRFLNGTLSLHTKFERELAEFLGKDDVVSFSTGFQTNLGIISAVAGRNDIIFCDKENHASIYDGCKLSYAQMVRYNHNDMADLENALKEAPENKGRIIVTDGVFSMSGDLCKLPEIVKLAKTYGARVMVDDAHGFGTIGNHGRGTADYFGLTDKVDIIMGTLSKSLASCGGYCACDAKTADYIRHSSRPYIFCASIPPANAAASNKALDIIKSSDKLTKQLQDNAKYVREGLTKRNIKFHSDCDIIPIVPIYTYQAEKTLIICKKLFEIGVYVNPVLPPATPEGECLIRTSYMATHPKALLDKAMDIIAATLKEEGV